MRTGSWLDACMVRANSATAAGGCTRRATRIATLAIMTKPSISAVCVQRLLSCVSTTEMARIGPSSPTAPAATTKLPNGVSSSPASRRMGNSVPIAVVVRAIVIMMGARTNPIASRTDTAHTARTSESSHPAPASASGRPRRRSKSISSPARKNRNVIPRIPRKPRTPSARASPSPCGPTAVPSAISRTTIGRRRPMGSSAMRGATTAISATISSVDRLKSRRSSTPALLSHLCRERANSHRSAPRCPCARRCSHGPAA